METKYDNGVHNLDVDSDHIGSDNGITVLQVLD